MYDCCYSLVLIMKTTVIKSSILKRSSLHIVDDHDESFEIDFDDTILKHAHSTNGPPVNMPNYEQIQDVYQFNPNKVRFVFRKMKIHHYESHLHSITYPTSLEDNRLMIDDIVVWLSQLKLQKTMVQIMKQKLEAVLFIQANDVHFIDACISNLIQESSISLPEMVLLYCMLTVQWYVEKINIYHMLRRDTATLHTTITELKRITLCPMTMDSFIENPYQVKSMKHEGKIKFKTLDSLALQYNTDVKIRCVHLIEYNLFNLAEEDGHTCYPMHSLINVVAEQCIRSGHKDINKQLVREVIKNNPSHFKCIDIDSETYVYLSKYYHNEHTIAKLVSGFVKQNTNLVCEEDVSNLISEYEYVHSIKLHTKQSRAVTDLLTKENIFVITGYPGTGKSSVTACINYIAKKKGLSTLLCAPTGKAAVRLGNESKTIHRALECYVDSSGEMHFRRNAQNKLQEHIVIVDECSMIDTHIMLKMLHAVNHTKTKLLILGDNKQLPSVGPGDILSQFIDSTQIPRVHLTKIFRQDSGSRICKLSKYAAMGEQIPKSLVSNNDDVVWINISDSLKVKKQVLELYKRHGGEAQVLIPNKKGEIGVGSINSTIHNHLFSDSPDQLCYGDRVVCTKNCYAYHEKSGETDIDNSVFNGETGTVNAVKIKTSGNINVTVDFGSKTIDQMSKDDLEFAYALTVHKSQGSEYDTVILVLSENSVRLLTREVLYTAITRAKKKLYIIGCENAIFTALMTPASKRHTNLAYFINQIL